MGQAATTLRHQLARALRRAEQAEASEISAWSTVSEIGRRAGVGEVDPEAGPSLRAPEHRRLVRAFLRREIRRARPGPLHDLLVRWLADLSGIWEVVDCIEEDLAKWPAEAERLERERLERKEAARALRLRLAGC